MSLSGVVTGFMGNFGQHRSDRWLGLFHFLADVPNAGQHVVVEDHNASAAC